MTDIAAIRERLRELAEATSEQVHPVSWPYWVTQVLMAGPARDFIEAASPQTVLALLADTPSVEPALDGALRACEKALPDGWALLMGHDENGEWWATGSEPRDQVHHGYRIVSSSKDGVLYGTAVEALNALAVLLTAKASDSKVQP